MVGNVSDETDKKDISDNLETSENRRVSFGLAGGDIGAFDGDGEGFRGTGRKPGVDSERFGAVNQGCARI
jgi:hypothetical protein